MKKQYSSFPLDEQNPAFPDEKEMFWPTLMVRVGKSHQQTPRFPAVVDSGSPWCIFKSDIGKFLEIDVYAGKRYKMGGVISGITEPIYFHKVKIYVEQDWVIDVTAGFADKLGVTGILGRTGFFDNFHVHFDHSVKPPILQIDRIQKPN